MAVDTFAKRASASSMLLPFFAKGVIPGGSVDQADRQDVVWTYRGILAFVVPMALYVARLLHDKHSAVELHPKHKAYPLRDKYKADEIS